MEMLRHIIRIDFPERLSSLFPKHSASARAMKLMQITKLTRTCCQGSPDPSANSPTKHQTLNTKHETSNRLPGLAPAICSALDTSQPINNILAAVITLRLLLHNYQFSHREDQRVIASQIVHTTFPLLAPLMVASLQSTTGDPLASTLQTQILKCFRCAIYTDLPPLLQDENTMMGWISLFYQALSTQVPPELSTGCDCPETLKPRSPSIFSFFCTSSLESSPKVLTRRLNAGCKCEPRTQNPKSRSPNSRRRGCVQAPGVEMQAECGNRDAPPCRKVHRHKISRCVEGVVFVAWGFERKVELH